MIHLQNENAKMRTHTIRLLAVCAFLSVSPKLCSEGHAQEASQSTGGDYRLTLIFACGAGCGSPEQITIATPYTYEQCQAAGGQWLSPQANPAGALSGFQCNLSG
jgi:hypothetical protein